MTAPRFVHLRVHSEYSLADSIVKVKPLVARARSLDMPALALTDRANLFALVKYYRTCLDAGIKPLVGVDLPVLTDSGERCRLGVMAMDDTGYRNLLTLVSGAYVGCVERGAVSREQLFERADGLLVLSGGREGDVGQLLLKGDEAGAERLAADWARAFPDRYYLELTRTGRQGEESHIALAVPLAAKLGLPVVATNDVCFLSEDDFEAHETRVCIHDGRTLDDPRRERRYSPQQYLKSAEEMAELFADLPEALDNSVEIARRCNVQVALGKYYLPNYPVPEGVSLEAFLEQEARAGLDDKLRRLEELGELTLPVADYTERLDYELGIINQMGFPGYFLIVMEFIGWAKRNDIPVGPGRGSGGGSLVAYALGITDMDPLRYDLLFERFLNPERVSMPDFDIDFCMEGRDRVIAHVSERYGQDAVSQIITFGTMAAKAVVRDVARVQGKPYGLADKLSKLIPFEVGMTLTKAVEQSKELVAFIEENDEVGEIMEMAYKLEGVVRGVGRHAGGVVIAPSALTDFVPLYVDELSGGLVSQFDKDDVESAGLVKFDFPRPEDADHRAVGGAGGERAPRRRPAADPDRPDPARRPDDLRAAQGRRDHRGVPARIPGHEGSDQAPEAGPLRRHHRAGGAVPAGSAAVRGRGRLHRPQARPQAGRLSPSGHGAGAVHHLRGHALSGAGDAVRPGAGRLQPRPGRPAAPGHGQEEARGDGQGPGRVPRRLPRARRGRAASPTTSST